MAQRDPADAQEWQFAEVLALVDHVQAHTATFAHAQTALERTWRTVADEIIDAFEQQTPGRACEATGQEIQQMLHTLGPLTFNRALPTDSIAGRWYQRLWLPEETATFTQQWVPFLRAFQQRCVERFPVWNQAVSFEATERSPSDSEEEQ